MKKIILLFIIAFYSFSFLVAQGSNEYLVHWDKPYYSSGETMFYTLHLPNQFDGKNVAVQVNISSMKTGKSKAIYYHKSNDNNHIDGYYKIPTDFNSGNYRLNFSLSDLDSKLFDRVAFADIWIFNNFEESKIKETVFVNSLNLEESNLSIEVEYANDRDISRKNQSMSVQVTDENGRKAPATISVSITDKSLIYGNGNAAISASLFQNYTIVNPSDRLMYCGQGVALKRRRKAKQAAGAYNSAIDKFMFAKPMTDEKFVMELNDFYDDQKFQFLDADLNNFPINDNYYALESELANTNTTAISNATISSYLETETQLKKINQYFKKDIAYPNHSEDVFMTPKPNKASVYFNLSEYKNFKTLGSFFSEISSSLKFKKNKENIYSAQLSNPNYVGLRKFTFQGNPTFIVDGIVTKDANLVGNLDFNQVESIEVFHDPTKLIQMYNMMGKSGLAKVKTKIPDFEIDPNSEAYNITLGGIQAAGAWNEMHGLSQFSNSVPLLQPTLFWSPSIDTDDNGKATFQFLQSDDKSTFLVTIIAKSETGAIGFKQIEYSTQQQ